MVIEDRQGLDESLAGLLPNKPWWGLWAALHPEIGLQDRIAGTWLVPR